MLNSEKFGNGVDYEETIYKYLYKLPPKGGRYIVVDTETTGLEGTAQIVELGAHEIVNGKLTGNQFHIYIRPRIQMDKYVINIHKITNNFYDEYYSDVYESDKQNLLNFSKFVGNSLIFAHNAPFDMGMINSELKYWNLNEIPIKRFRCSMRIFKDIIGKIAPRYSDTFTSLSNCCEYFKLKSSENNFHNALFDSFMTSRMICKIYETLDKNVNLRKNLGYDQKAIDCFFRESKRKKNDLKKNSKIKNDENIKKSNNKNKNLNLNLIKSAKSIKKMNNLNISDKININNLYNLYPNKKLKDLKFKNKNLDKIRAMINTEIEEKFKNIQPINKNLINKEQKNLKNKEINYNINNDMKGTENEDFLDEEEIDDIFLELL